MIKENKNPYYEIILYIKEDKEVIIGNFQSIIISIRDTNITTIEKLLEYKNQVAFILEHGVIFKPLWEQYKQRIYQRSKKFNITYPNETGRYELEMCCCDEIKFLEINGTKTGLVDRVEGFADDLLYFPETLDEFKKRCVV